jgi:hypothetical protein
MPSSRSKLPAPLLAELWARMHVVYPHRWGSAVGQTPDGVAGAMWAAELGELSAGEIARGLQACIASPDEWPPGPGDFRAMCLGAERLSVVIDELRPNGPRPSGFTRMVWARIDGHRYRGSGGSAQDAMVRMAWEQARRALLAGEPLPREPAADLPRPDTAPYREASPEAVAAAAAKLEQVFGRAPDPAPTPLPHGLSPIEMEAYEAALAAEKLARQVDRKSAAAGERDEGEPA